MTAAISLKKINLTNTDDKYILKNINLNIEKRIQKDMT